MSDVNVGEEFVYLELNGLPTIVAPTKDAQVGELFVYVEVIWSGTVDQTQPGPRVWML